MNNPIASYSTQHLAFIPSTPLTRRLPPSIPNVPAPFADHPQSVSTPLTRLFSEIQELDPDKAFDLNELISPPKQSDMRNPAISPSEMRGLLKMARLNAAPMGAGLVALGAYGARRAAQPLDSAMQAQLALSSLLTVIVTTTSMLINDYYDYEKGVDTAENKPNRPLVTGEVKPETVMSALKWGYAAHLMLLSLVDRAPTRLWIGANTMLTQCYTQHLKPITGVKNASCAAVVAMAIGLGALTVGGPRALSSVWRPMAVVAGTICHREMMMDIKDSDGDAKAGVKTVPVVLGDKKALVASMVPMALSLVASITQHRIKWRDWYQPSLC